MQSKKYTTAIGYVVAAGIILIWLLAIFALIAFLVRAIAWTFGM